MYIFENMFINRPESYKQTDKGRYMINTTCEYVWYVCMCIYNTYIHTHTHTHTHIHIHKPTSESTILDRQEWSDLYVSIYVQVCIYMRMYVCIEGKHVHKCTWITQSNRPGRSNLGSRRVIRLVAPNTNTPSRLLSCVCAYACMYVCTYVMYVCMIKCVRP